MYKDDKGLVIHHMINHTNHLYVDDMFDISCLSVGFGIEYRSVTSSNFRFCISAFS